MSENTAGRLSTVALSGRWAADNAAVMRLNPAAVVRVNSGGGAYTATTGEVWSADTGYLNGYTYSTTTNVTNTTEPTLYKSTRYYGTTLQYRFTVANGSYTVRLKFAEIYWTAAGKRVFDIKLNGQTVQKRQKWATYWRDETGLEYAMARYRSAGGRFLSPDPYQASGGPGVPQSWNRYAYVENDPVNFYDPAGEIKHVPDPPEAPERTTDRRPHTTPDVRPVKQPNPEFPEKGKPKPAGGSPRPECDRSNPSNARILDFIDAHRRDAQTLANKLDVSVEWILGVSAVETGWGESGIAENAHNFFGLHAPKSGNEYKGQTGVFTTSGGVRVAAFSAETGYLDSGMAFVGLVDRYVHGETDVDRFAASLHQHGYGTTNPKYEGLLEATIGSVTRRIDCPR